MSRPPRRNRDFMLLWSGQVVSSLGSAVSSVAFPLLVLALTGSLAKAGLAGSNFIFQALVLVLIVLAQSRGASYALVGLTLGLMGANRV